MIVKAFVPFSGVKVFVILVLWHILALSAAIWYNAYVG